METVPQNAAARNFDTILRTLAVQALSRYAGESARIERGLLIALNGGVTLHTDGTALVRSQSDAEVVYHVNGHCDCPDATRATEGRCKHRWAKQLVKRAIDQAEQATPSTKAYYAHMYNESGILSKVGGTIYFIPDCGGVIVEVEPEMFPFITTLGNVALADTQMIVDTIRGGCAALATSRAN